MESWSIIGTGGNIEIPIARRQFFRLLKSCASRVGRFSEVPTLARRRYEFRLIQYIHRVWGFANPSVYLPHVLEFATVGGFAEPAYVAAVCNYVRVLNLLLRCERKTRAKASVRSNSPTYSSQNKRLEFNDV